MNPPPEWREAFWVPLSPAPRVAPEFDPPHPMTEPAVTVRELDCHDAAIMLYDAYRNARCNHA